MRSAINRLVISGSLALSGPRESGDGIRTHAKRSLLKFRGKFANPSTSSITTTHSPTLVQKESKYAIYRMRSAITRLVISGSLALPGSRESGDGIRTHAKRSLQQFRGKFANPSTSSITTTYVWDYHNY
ncbi:hypothetical protein PoB_006607400 [Plakobranchus ocellatus]|uniref:Uncharacterized protein n=1 Tax=Plakobranchus ocellatus TaxID=259542 RepID=A0AAV4D5Z1_9GAST|nr:hypothetical protein PoB_006607400 [Plakobranchus ocellatus]